MTRFVALYKTFRGNEFLESSIESIYNHVDKIVFVNSDTSWSGEKGNDCIEVIENWKRNSDENDKIVNINISSISQDEQYHLGITYIENHFDFEYLMIVDTDEVWNEEDLVKAQDIVRSAPYIDSFTCSMDTYIKSPFYRLDPPEPCKPVVFVKKGNPYSGVRFNGIKNRLHMNDIKFHHFTYVRKSEDLVFSKIITSTSADKEKTVNLDIWKKEKWDLLPHACNFHTSKGYEHYWKGIKEITLKDLPMSFQLREHEIIKMFEPPTKNERKNEYFYDFMKYRYSSEYKNLPYGALSIDDEYILYEYSKGSDISVEIGTFLGRSASILSAGSKQVISFDIFERINDIEDEKNRDHYARHYEENPHSFKDVRDSLEHFKNISVRYRENKWVEIPDINFLFLDADHSYKGVKKDFNEMFNNVIRGGIIAFHDSYYNESAPHHEVYKFLEELKKRSDVEKIDSNGSVTIWRKQ